LRWYKLASEVNGNALQWIDQNRKDSFFAWIHYSDPHYPYNVHDVLPDMEVLVNGEAAAQFAIVKHERNRLKVVLNPGLTVLEFRPLAVSHGNAHINKVSISSRRGIDLKLKGELPDGERRAEKHAWKGYTHAEITNNNEGPVQVIIDLRGKVYQPLDTIRWHYTREVQYMDRFVGEVWKKLEEWDLKKNTVVAITADHGESLGEHNKIGHLFPLYTEIIHVPFILYAPWPARSAEVSQLVNHQDILPTVLSLLRIDPGIKLQGYNLKSQLDWHPLGRLWSSKRTRTFCSTYAPQGKSNSFAVIEESLKVIKTRQTGGWRWEAYDLKNDPSELNDFMKAGIPQELNSRISGLQQLLNEFASEAEQAHTNRKVPKLDENQLEMLKDLGYIAN
jgi:hypothetical protein